MARYLLLWEVAEDKVPIDPKERGAAWGMLLALVEADLKKGVLKDWGGFVGELGGYCVAEGTEVEIGTMVQQYTPFVLFQTHPVASLGQVQQLTAALQ